MKAQDPGQGIPGDVTVTNAHPARRVVRVPGPTREASPPVRVPGRATATMVAAAEAVAPMEASLTTAGRAGAGTAAAVRRVAAATMAVRAGATRAGAVRAGATRAVTAARPPPPPPPPPRPRRR